MKKITLSILVLMFSTIMFAQDANDSIYVTKFIEISAMAGKSVPDIDTGEAKGTSKYKTEQGEKIEFYSAVGALNWFVAHGWTFVSSDLSVCNDRTVKMYVVSKRYPIENTNKYVKN